MLSAANENVLIAVEGCWLEREPATPWVVSSRTSPRLAVDEVTTILNLLHADGYLRTEQAAVDEPRAFVPTERGRAEVTRVVAALNQERPTTGESAHG